MRFLTTFILLLISVFTFGQNTETVFLSGTGADDTMTWEFYCSAGQNSGKWATIEVPSCWEQQGFGSYDYGHVPFDKRLNEEGIYRKTFNVPKSWRSKEVEIVFEGVMTDALVKVNGKVVGPVHQGAFYRFSYSIGRLLKYGKENRLEVLVKKHSDNESVSYAERKADYWIFGGIFRPVYLEVKPKAHIKRVAIDAKANGSFRSRVDLSKVSKVFSLTVDIIDSDKRTVATFKGGVTSKNSYLTGKLESPKLWNSEEPNLYTAVFELKKNGKVVHRYLEKFGFRTIEFREMDGIYVNGVRIKLKGVNRHVFHPKFGRTSSKKLSIEAVNLIKDMNMNAVRMSHYSPDKHMLDVCDSLGLYVLDELCTWHKPTLDFEVGEKLVKELIDDDVNHPSIIAWDNGNEGGWNNSLNNHFAQLDIQKREVLHPWQSFQKTNTYHYHNYNYLALDGFEKRKIFLPTEVLHGLYDGGHGAGLEDYWLRIWNHPQAAGGFLWVFADEGIERTDKNNAIDVDGNHAPDGILGPYMEKEASFYTIQKIWSPVYFEKRYITPEFDGLFRVQNRYHFTNFSEVNFEYRWVKYSSPDSSISSKTIFNGKIKSALKPGENGILQVEKPANWKTADALEISAINRYGRKINRWTWPVKFASVKAKEQTDTKADKEVDLEENKDSYIVKVGTLNYVFGKDSGMLKKVSKSGEVIPLSEGPIFASTEMKTEKVEANIQDGKVIIKTFLKNGKHNDSFVWTIKKNGLLNLLATYTPKGGHQHAGVSFNYPEENVSGMRWMGNGPHRVWKNRIAGPDFGVWEKELNNTQTGVPNTDYKYPEFKGYYAETYWVKVLNTRTSGFKAYIHTDDIFLRMLTPEFPSNSRQAKASFPAGDISFLHSIPPIGTKFKKTSDLGPMSASTPFNSRRIDGGKANLEITFDFE
ncbi:beta-galactosidase (plasmid) [Fulvitalea axinellae]|uniref:beta-galactosidase n=1 Tax=Fulvitalea axinellae TaxID=1182444 RepID=A0AAU9CTZ8_9BACT|nr:beta-galactosidase [Fulvitalea axinellae]